jgi:uridine kinase
MIGNEKEVKSDLIVLGIAGPSGSGKSTLVRKIITFFDGSDNMHYDDYQPNYDRLTNDLEDLRNGKTITYPINNRQIHPKKFIVIEEPTGRQRQGMDNKIDYLVYINVPLEISFARVLLRSIEQSTDQTINSFYETIGPQFTPRFSEKPTKLMHIQHWQLSMYIKEHRQIYLRDHNFHLNDADLVIDGMKDPNELADDIKEKFTEWLEK